MYIQPLRGRIIKQLSSVLVVSHIYMCVRVCDLSVHSSEILRRCVSELREEVRLSA